MPIKKKLRKRRAITPAACALFFTIFAALVFVSHAPFLGLPFFWDEAGQFVPAALETRSFQLALGDWDAGPDPDVSSFWRSNAVPPQGFNVAGGPTDPFLDRALDSLATLNDPQARVTAAQDVSRFLAGDAIRIN